MSLTDLARRMFRRPTRQACLAKPRRSARLMVTTLEDRSVPAAISGTVFFDTNADGIQDNNESTAPGVTVRLDNHVDPTVTGTTDNFGHYAFVDLSTGYYVVSFTAPTGYTVGTPVGGYAMVFIASSDVTVNAGMVGGSGGGTGGDPDPGTGGGTGGGGTGGGYGSNHL